MEVVDLARLVTRGAGRIIATEDAWLQLPELSYGLVPGAGGTVSLPGRIGRWH